ncbi:MAG: alkaline phosphatase [Bacteroidales bacterium]|nr:alkaline phosphatase [Bacteroidales bacterium]MCF8458094.1 alkaline phosphatase [Bacteroidales bacterium]
MRNKAIALVFILTVATQWGCGFRGNDTSEKNNAGQKLPVKSPKNIIFMVGDGMGTSQVFAALTAKKGKLEMARCKSTGFNLTQSADNYITDSAAGATAFATGKRNNNGCLSISPTGDTLKTILEMAEDKGLSTGLVATCKITHATPAAFICHNQSRDNYEELALDFLKTDVDVFIGGGRDNFEKRGDSLDLSERLRKNGYDVLYSLDELKTSKAQKIAGLLYPDHPIKMSEGRGDMLEVSSLKAIELLDKNEKGFFLMIEGSQIDWGGHDKDSEYLVSEAVDFDNVIGKVLDFAEKDGETLVVITADHECGGYALMGGNMETGEVSGAFTSGDHTAVMVPIFAFGPGAENFSGIIKNTDFFDKFIELFGF